MAFLRGFAFGINEEEEEEEAEEDERANSEETDFILDFPNLFGLGVAALIEAFVGLVTVM